MPAWQWKDWSVLLTGYSNEVMLTATGQEAVWYKVWKKLGLTDQEIRSFTDLRIYPGINMANMMMERSVTHEWLDIGGTTEKDIFRERELNMKPECLLLPVAIPPQL